ncbi:hypothetical protein IWW55_002059 [Coemansia sp. RSA 2706]|nr:hypothetical protein IWW55_002059 [Coemansia sp. RSA 2706]KAJ2315222.1 hypothetical protein IWW54_000442 [Coemansia sp. RSA 2705]KAJ2319492.1 hypothetical protein IWW52_001935 [Coemansia sp. RSA 2704]KAJ2327342.1 hypothetical protein IWW51_001801 [Coemansia sp. RSA 2702]KAJ2380179.1 hypothetical protein H4S02_006812 [Coemansia sp. RSA 2611]KAJ2737463.1 hypothetical protein H4R23_001824 [Coemansia sp. Cherry 401B]
MLNKIISFAVAAMAMAATVPAAPLAGRSTCPSKVNSATAEPKGAEVSAVIKFARAADGNGLDMTVSASGLTKGAEYPYHIHVDKVPADGNCTATGGHLNPHNIDSTVTCDPSDILNTCELGDLAGVFGKMVGDDNGEFGGSFKATQLAFSGENTILDHSIVIHNADGDRIACANIVS